jgi:hypothetical protein
MNFQERMMTRRLNKLIQSYEQTFVNQAWN